MPLEFLPQCCDASLYLNRGAACAAAIAHCWDPLRPIGMALYASVPRRLGLRAEMLIVMNALLTIASALSGAAAIVGLLSARATRLSRAAILLASLASHAFFMWQACRSSASDVPAAALAMLSLWLLLIGGIRDDTRAYAAAGALLGGALFVRAYYLYPAVLVVLSLAVLAAVRKERALRVALFCGAALLPAAIQVSVTHSITGTWSFIDQKTEDENVAPHFENTIYAYDTVLNQGGLFVHYDAPECFSRATGVAEAVKKHEWLGIACLVERRQEFYFGSFVWGGKIYLMDAAERRFSLAFLFANAVAFAIACVWVSKDSARRRLFAVPFVFLVAIWGEGSLILPEMRFLMAVHVPLWMLTAAGIHEFIWWFRHSPSSAGVDRWRAAAVAWLKARQSSQPD